MAFSVHIRELAHRKIDVLAKNMAAWEAKQRIEEPEAREIRKTIRKFNHTATVGDFYIAGVDGSGDYPSLSYADSFVYVASATGTAFRTDSIHGLEEVELLPEPVLEFVWLPGNRKEAAVRWDGAFAALAGRPIEDVISDSDYRFLKKELTGDSASVKEITDGLIRPAGSDTSNVAIQLRSTAELGAALRLIVGNPRCRYVLNDTTLSLPMVTRKELSLFYEHVKRLCCVEARQRGITFATLSKSHGLPAMDLLEGLARDVLENKKGETAEHWFMRLPMDGVDSWKFSLTEDRTLPPVGAVTYLFRLHRNTPVMRLDLDRAWWEIRLRSDPKAEEELFADLDYCGHDQRSYGYPYPIKACHDRVRLSEDERRALKTIIIETAVRNGIKHHVFRDVSMSTGHS